MDTKATKKTTSDTTSDIRSESTLCVGNCGFYGVRSNGNYCSSCFKKHKSKMRVEESDSPKSTSIKILKTDVKKRKVQKNKKRCFSCRKKLGFTGIECRCGYIFCSEHRYAESHECDFDYSTYNKSVLKERTNHARYAKVDKL